MWLSFRLAAGKELSKKKKKKKVQGGARRCRRTLLKPNSKAVALGQIPQDVLMEILSRLPSKSVMRFKCVSKLWSLLLSSKYFTNLFLKTPSPRRLFAYIVNKDRHSEFALLSSSPNPGSVSLLDQDIKIQGIGGYMVNALRGLVCFRTGTRLQICNLTTKQHVELPILTSNIIIREFDENPWNYFGHDSVNDEYKVLSTIWEVSKEKGVVRSEHQVLVLGPGANWRSTQCTHPPPPHRPYTQGFSINGVLYYGAWIGKNGSLVMSFDLTSEEFTVIKLPVDETSPNLMNYRGKLAVFEYSNESLASDGSVDLWIMEDAGKSLWSEKKSLVLPVSQMNFVSYNTMWMQGTSCASEVRLANVKLELAQPIHFVTYDMERNKITSRVEIGPLRHKFGGVYKCVQSDFWDDIETILYLET